MQEAKSTLLLGQQPKKQSAIQQLPAKQVEYKHIGSNADKGEEPSDEQREEEFNRMHEEYISMKLTRKKELLKFKKEEFGTSSSDQQDNSSQEQDGEIGTKVEVKKQKGKCSEKELALQEQNKIAVVLQLKKLVSQTELVFLEKEFEINKKVITYARINKLSLCLGEIGNKNVRRLRVGIGSDEDVVISVPQILQNKSKDKLMDVFLRFLQIKLELKSIKLTELTKSKAEQLGELSEDALFCDKIYKKSQIIGTWEQRYIVIKNDGLHSHRTPKSKATMFIPANSIKQVQTQFEFYKEQLVFKLIYANNVKTDFGLPLDSKLQWVCHFANLLRQ